MTTGSRVPSGVTVMKTTFLRVSAAVQGRSGRGWALLSSSTSVSMVGTSGVSTTRAAGASSHGTGSGAGTVTASTLAA